MLEAHIQEQHSATIAASCCQKFLTHLENVKKIVKSPLALTEDIFIHNTRLYEIIIVYTGGHGNWSRHTILTRKLTEKSFTSFESQRDWSGRTTSSRLRKMLMIKSPL
ncbi:hypothetical protein SFRURICE_007398 [Spodoptera frugiperda]|nr:hypothetical protein SFRURICE_007398 [Spodoptera frugiperda]